MRRVLRNGLFCLISLACLSQAGVVSSHGALKVKGNRIVDASGNPIQLAGMSMFWSGWMGKYWNSGVVGTLSKDWNSSLVRASMGVQGGGNYLGPKDPKDPRSDEQIKTENKNMVKAVVDAAIANDIYVIIDWHDHNANQHVAESKAFFSEMAQLYKNTPNLIWELWNEPENTNGTGADAGNGNRWDSWAGDIKPYAETVTAEIRKYSSNLVVVGTPVWSQNVDEAAAAPVRWAREGQTFHLHDNRVQQITTSRPGVALP